MKPRRGGLPGSLLLLQARELQKIVIGPALLGIAEDFAGADDLPEFQRRVGIAGAKVGMGAFDGPAERGPETFGVVGRKRPEQIVKRLHRRSRCWSFVSVGNSRREFTVENAHTLNIKPCG